MKWKVSETPTGRYRSFQKRAWPTLVNKEGQFLAFIDCQDDYQPRAVRENRHSELKVMLFDHTECTPGSLDNRKTRILKARFKTLPEAKAAAEGFLKRHPNWLPKD